MHISSSRASRSVFSAAIVLSLLVSACGGTTSDTSCTQQYWDGSVGICLTAGWQVMEKERLAQLGVPEEVAAAFQADKPTSGQFPNVTITKEVLGQPMDSVAYSKSSMQAVSTLPAYTLIDSQATTIDGSAVQVHIYSAQPVADQPKVRFYQVSAVSASGTGYTVTAFAPLTVPQTLDKQIITMLKSFTLTEPKKK